MRTPQPIIFDLYGTLLTTPPNNLHRQIPKVLGVSTRAWLSIVRDKLLTQPFATAEALVHFVREELAPWADLEQEARCVEIIAEELEHVRPMPGVLSLLAFLRSRGHKLGLLSNLSSSYIEPLDRAGMSKLFDVTYFSCDEGIRKPSREAYLETARRLEAEPDDILFVGDSIPNDVEAPTALGMKTIHVGGTGVGAVPETHLIGLIDLSVNGMEPMIRVGAIADLPAGKATVTALTPVSDDEQGRYNLVYRVETDCATAPVNFIKRFLLPESAHVEELAYRIHAIVGLPTCRAAIVDCGEPLLALTQAAGEKYEAEMDPQLAWEMGRHIAFAYVFSNADIRPRNAFLHRGSDRPEVTMIDLEHCFFNLAINPAELDDPFDPACLDAAPELTILKKVLTDRAMRRARRTFVQEESIPAETYRVFQTGFREFFLHMSSIRSEIVSFLDERVHRAPYLVIGTHSYRRAMASVDVLEIDDRLTHDPDQVMSRFC